MQITDEKPATKPNKYIELAEELALEKEDRQDEIDERNHINDLRIPR